MEEVLPTPPQLHDDTSAAIREQLPATSEEAEIRATAEKSLKLRTCSFSMIGARKY